MMKQTDNDKVNALWLARYDPGRERVKPPNGNQDQNHLRAWIRRKYQDKQWYANGSAGGPPQQHGTGGSQQQRQNGGRGGAPPQPTMVQIPPAAAAAAPPVEVDLFASFEAPAPAPQPSANQPPKSKDDWAGFGGSSQKQQNFADFDGHANNNSNGQADPFAQAPVPQQQPPQQNFTSFGGGPATNADPFAQAPQQQQQPQEPLQSFANFGGQQQQPQNFASFAGQPQQQQSADTFSQPPPPQQPQVNFASFNNQPQPASMPQPQQQPVQQLSSSNMQHSQTPPNNEFANFNQPSPQYPSNAQQGGFSNVNQPQQQMVQHSQMQAPAMQSDFSPGQPFGGLNPDQQQQQPHQMMQGGNPQPHQMMQGGNNGTFSQIVGPQQQPQQQQQRPEQQDPFSSTHTPHMSQQGPSNASGMVQQQMNSTNVSGGPNNFQSQNYFANVQQSQSDAPVQPQAPQTSNPLDPQSAMQQAQQQPNQSAAMTTGLKQDPMDAFAHLDMNGPSSAKQLTAVENLVPPQSQSGSGGQFSAEQIVCYKTNGDRMKAKIIKVHLDDELHPYYSVLLPFGKEKQTDNTHLEALDPAFEAIEAKLITLSAPQLKKVDDFITSLKAQNDQISSPHSTLASLPPPKEDAKKLESVPSSVRAVSPAGMSHISQLTQPQSNQMQLPPLSMQAQAPAVGNIGALSSGVSGGAGSGLNSIPSPMPMEKPAAPSVGAGAVTLPPLERTQNFVPPQQGSTSQMMPSQVAPAMNAMGMPQQFAQPSNMGMNQMHASQQSQGMSIPSPDGRPSIAPQQGGTAGMSEAVGAPPLMQPSQQPSATNQSQNTTYGGHMSGQMQQVPYPSSMQHHQGNQPGWSQQVSQQEIVQQQIPQQQIPQQPMIQVAQNQFGQAQQQSQLPQAQGQPAQTSQPPQGNPFDMY